ncbi:unnamed protein product [Periconia digitata]|uniref:Uncharacterized protein n=1 Tax=Periconia digitata TaxID=1303443 RepID=A0A9W4U0V1_9PLEO|nr:unnamed protein product [Periconia digitata]
MLNSVPGSNICIPWWRADALLILRAVGGIATTPARLLHVGLVSTVSHLRQTPGTRYHCIPPNLAHIRIDNLYLASLCALHMLSRLWKIQRVECTDHSSLIPTRLADHTHCTDMSTLPPHIPFWDSLFLIQRLLLLHLKPLNENVA